MSKKEFGNLPVRTQNLYNMLNNLIVTLCALNNDEIKTAAASSAGLHGVSDFKKLKGKIIISDRIKNLDADKDAAIIEGLLILNESEKNRLYVSDSGCGPDGCVDFEIKDGYLSFFCNDVCLNRINLHNKTE
ncbi:MAG: hypothetical protein IJJ61_07105 [Clostridia bacterium]|nr:hypothetical protein [Clostridia bacterium]